MSISNITPCGISIPQVFPKGHIDVQLLRNYAAQAEKLGYHSLWVQEQIIGSSASLEPISLLNYIAAITDTISLGTAVIIITTRNPVLLAKELSTLDQISNGRLIVGLALGGKPEQYALLGASRNLRVRHFQNSLRIIKSLWAENIPHLEDLSQQFNGIAMEPKPLQNPHPPIWFGGRHPNALKRSVKQANGWIGAGSTTTEQFKHHVKLILRELADSQRDLETFTISKRVYLAIDDNEGRAENRLRKWFSHRYGNAEMASRVSIWGSASKCTEELTKIIQSGAQVLILNPVFDHWEHLETLARDVVPNLKSTH